MGAATARAVRRWLRAAVPTVAGIALSACSRQPSAPSRFVAGADGQAAGVSAFEVLAADSRNLSVRLMGRRTGTLDIAAQGGTTTQRLVLTGTDPVELRTSWDRVDVVSGGQSQQVARRSETGWVSGDSISQPTLEQVAVVLAMDVDLAVQGTSMAFGGRVYAWCTPSCVRATNCARRGEIGRCAEAVSTCGACLEQEPSR